MKKNRDTPRRNRLNSRRGKRGYRATLGVENTLANCVHLAVNIDSGHLPPATTRMAVSGRVQTASVALRNDLVTG